MAISRPRNDRTNMRKSVALEYLKSVRTTQGRNVCGRQHSRSNSPDDAQVVLPELGSRYRQCTDRAALHRFLSVTS
jgi:hypothetical protein